MASRPSLRRASKHLATAVDHLRPTRPGITLLIYHRVGGGSTSDVDLPVDTFDRQLGHLTERGPVVSLDTALELLEGAADVDVDPVVVTFDDGTADFVDHAVPRLVHHGVPALLYVASAHIDEQRAFPGGAPPCSWAGLREAASTGLVTVGSHTHRHRLLDRLAPREVVDELERSIDRIGSELGAAPAHFAYPKALAPSSHADQAVRARFASAALAGSRPNRYGATDPHRLARSPIQHSDGMRFFRAKVAGGMAAEDWARRARNRRRYAHAVS